MTGSCTETKTLFGSPLSPSEAAVAFVCRSWRSVRSAVIDVLEIKVCGEMDVIGCILFAGFAAIVVHPLVYGNLGNSVMALMTPVR